MIFLGKDNNVGCFVVKKLSLFSSRGAMIEFQTNEYGEGNLATLPGRGMRGLLITGISTVENESVSHLPCFGDKIYTYAYGMKPGTVHVNVLAFMGSYRGKSNTEGNYLRQLFGLYRHNRISKALNTVRIVFPGNEKEAGASLVGNLVGMQTSTRDVDVGLQQATLQLVTTEPIGSDQ